MPTSGTMAASKTSASATSPSTPYSALTPARNQIMGSLRVSRARSHQRLGGVSTMSLTP